MPDIEQRLPDVWIDEGDALRDSGFVMPNPDLETDEYVEPVDLHGLTHDQLVFIGLAESRAVDLLKDAEGNALEAALAIKPPAEAFVEANPIAAAGNNLLRAMTYDLLIDPKAQAVERLTARAQAELEAERMDADAEGSNRPGDTMRILNQWQEDKPDDAGMKVVARQAEEIIGAWRAGERDDDETLEALYRHYHSTEGTVSEDASAMLFQAADWGFGYEADIPEDVVEGIRAAVRKDVLGYED